MPPPRLASQRASGLCEGPGHLDHLVQNLEGLALGKLLVESAVGAGKAFLVACPAAAKSPKAQPCPFAPLSPWPEAAGPAESAPLKTSETEGTDGNREMRRSLERSTGT